jgi:ribosomal protein S18 acetylase RimI-like enzyme
MHTHMDMIEIRPFGASDEEQTLVLWQRCELTRPWNDPRKDITRKLREHPELFLVAVSEGHVIASVMAGYDGHRGWMNYLAVDPEHRRTGVGRSLVEAAEAGLRALGCPKVNLQIRRDNLGAAEFYNHVGYREDDVVSFGKRLEHDALEPGASSAA